MHEDPVARVSFTTQDQEFEGAFKAVLMKTGHSVPPRPVSLC